MAAPAYTTDLSDINLAELTTNWTNIGTGALAAETDFFVQGSACISKPGWTGDATRGGIYNSGAGQTINTPNAYFAWVYFWGPGALETEANGGMQLIIGSSTTAYKQWYVRGSNTILPFDGWVCIPVDPSLAADATTGAPTSTLQYFGALARIKTGSAIGKGNPLGLDAIRHGRGTLQIVSGDLANGYGTFAGAETTANSTTNRWGLFQSISGGYLQQGLFLMGTSGTAVDFRDSNRNIVIANTKKVTSGFNTFEIRNASSRVDWTNISIASLGTVSRGNFIATDNATVNFTGCVFTDMGTFGFKSNSTALTTTFRRCNLITQSSAVMINCTFDSTNDTAKAVLCNSPTSISGCTFISSGTKHGMELTTAGTYNFVNNTFTGYAGSDGSTGNEAVYNNSGGSITLNITGATPSIRNGAGASTTIVAGTVTTEITVKDIDTNTAIQNARVIVTASDNTGPMPFEESIAISRSGSVATVTHTAHGLINGKQVLIKGSNQIEYNGVFTITVTNSNTYTYTVTGTPVTPATGTIKATGVVIYGLTNASGVISDTRTHSTSQPIIGRVRKATSGDLYKTGTISGTISSSTGFSTTVQMIKDI